MRYGKHPLAEAAVLGRCDSNFVEHNVNFNIAEALCYIPSCFLAPQDLNNSLMRIREYREK